MSETLTNEIQTRKEYIQSLVNDFGSGQIAQEKLIGELSEEFNKLYFIIQTLKKNRWAQ